MNAQVAAIIRSDVERYAGALQLIATVDIGSRRREDAVFLCFSSETDDTHCNIDLSEGGEAWDYPIEDLEIADARFPELLAVM